jgi:hypothetical protein
MSTPTIARRPKISIIKELGHNIQGLTNINFIFNQCIVTEEYASLCLTNHMSRAQAISMTSSHHYK